MHKISVFVFGTVIAGQVAAQDAGVCYSPGSIAASVLGTLFATLLLVGIGFGIYRYYCKKRRGKHLVLVTDPESAEYAFDNPCFRDGTPVNRTNPENDTSKLDSKAKWYAWSPIGTKFGVKNGRGKALDDSFMTEPRIAVVALKSHDFTGLGFNICGNMRDGIFIKDVLHRGPASESGCISPGDRIDSVRISFRHMVFEDALTILSYASPYDVQLEVENASTSRPSTLIRNKKTAASFGTADRICHPFYRSQSSSDLPQIGKSWRIEGVTVKSVPESRSGGQDDSKTGEYPTLKLSSSPSKPKDENTKSEKMSAPSRVSNDADTGIIKPERIKKINTKGIDSESSEKKHVDEEAGNKIQKFGVRVLPDAGKKEDSKIEKANNPLKNENVIITSVGFEPKRSVSPEAELHQNEKNTMIERVSNVPKGNENPKSSPVVAPKGTDEVDSNNTDNSTKRASTSIFYDERGIDVGPSEQTDSKDIQVKHILTKGLQNLKEKLHYEKKKGSSNSETGDENPSHSDKKTDMHITGNPGNTSHNEDKDEAYEKMISRIPTELPEEVLKAADFARNSRKPSNQSSAITRTTPERIRTASENSLSNESVGEDNSAGTGENFDPDAFPKKPYKRKAPPPPEEGKEELSFEIIEKENINDISNPESDNTDLGKAGKLFTTFANLAKRNNPDKFAKEESDIIIRTTDTSNFGLKRASVGNVGGFESDTLGNDMKNKNLDSLQTSDTNSESDSDMEADQSAGLKNKKVAKGGTTIELNSSHITVHHGPSSDNVVDLENENTRKAASLGDLSRLDTEQPMSILERAVSLDLADGGTPHGTKKRKAPLPPPCDEYLTSPDTDDGSLYKKEPRLEGAMDTFQRRRLKKSSDWGTLEDALQQSNDLPSFTAPAVWGKSQTYVSLEEKPNSTETSATESDESKQNLNEETDNTAEVPHSSSPRDFKYVSYSEANLVKNPLKSSQESINNDQNSHQKTILRISPDINNANPQVIIKPLTTFQVNDIENVVLPSSTENFTTRVISSTPLNISSSSSILDSSTPIHNHKNLNEFIQSPLITSSNTGVSSICVSSTTHNDLDLSDVDTMTAISSVTDPYYTAVDSTSIINDTLEEDLQPPELPSTPMPVLSTSSLPFVPSPSTTYITEIQVVTTGDEDTSLTLNTPVETPDVSSTIVETNHKYRPDSSLSSNSVGSMGDEQDVSLVENVKPVTNTVPHKSNVSITAIRGTSNSLGHTERSRIPMRIVTDPTRTVNNVHEEKRSKPNRPPVPPRKSESPSSLLPTVTVQLPSQIINSQPSTSKFISFSSLTPRTSATEDTTVNRNSSFEQWVFLDDKHSGKPNGLDNNDDSEIHDKRPHSTVVTLPSALPNRTQSITHIVLDTKSGSGKFA